MLEFLKIKYCEIRERKKVLKKYKNKDINMNLFNENFSIGKNSYFGKIDIISFTGLEKLKVGEYVSIADGVTFLLGGEHFYKGLSTYPFDRYRFKGQENTISKGDILIEDDVWIGYKATVLSGVKIRQGSIIGASSVVTKDTKPYGIYAGNPARFIKYRFDKELIQELVKLDISDILNCIEESDRDMIYKELNKDNLYKLIKRKNIYKKGDR